MTKQEQEVVERICNRSDAASAEAAVSASEMRTTLRGLAFRLAAAEEEIERLKAAAKATEPAPERAPGK